MSILEVVILVMYLANNVMDQAYCIVHNVMKMFFVKLMEQNVHVNLLNLKNYVG
jgi:hypothetical protein